MLGAMVGPQTNTYVAEIKKKSGILLLISDLIKTAFENRGLRGRFSSTCESAFPFHEADDRAIIITYTLEIKLSDSLHRVLNVALE